MRFIEILEENLGKKADKNFLPLQAGDVPATYANVEDLVNDVNYKPEMPIETGISNFVKWYRDYYQI
jgi:UDP-glucuronate 4-epimerase